MVPRRSMPRRATVLLAAVVAAGCTGGAPSLSPETTGPTVAPATPSPSPSIRPSPSPLATLTPAPPVPSPTAASTTWPPIGPVPEPDAIVSLLVAHVTWGDTGPTMQRLIILADGRVVMFRREFGDEGDTALLQRRLTTSGLAFVRDALVEVGLFDRDRTRELLEPLNCCGAGDQLRVRLGDTTVRVGRLLAPADAYAPSAPWDRFDALVEALRDVDGWIPADHWAAETWTAYHAASYCVTLTHDTWGERILDAATLTWPPGIAPLDAFGEPAWEGASTRVGIIDSPTAYALAGSIIEAANAAGIPRTDYYPIPLTDGGTRFVSPRISEDGVEWHAWLEPLPPRWQRCDPAG